jgi:ABC-type phosphate transport system substrate-binding protein
MSAFKQSMRKLGVRAGLLAGTSAAVLAIAGIGAGSAAAVTCPHPPAKIIGEGSSLQKIAQTEVWTTDYNAACAGTEPEVEYKSSSSGTGMAQWNYELALGHINHERAYIGTDDAPTTGQIGHINTTAEAEAGTGASHVAVVPVAQAAIAIIANPPKGCSITKLSQANLEQAFRGNKKTWTELGATGENCGTEFTRVVRADNSGTSYQSKHAYFAIHGAALPCTGTAGSELTWAGLQSASLNKTWPENGVAGCAAGTLTPVLHAKLNGTGEAGTGTGGGDEAKTVNHTASSIGYVALADAEANVPTAKEKEEGVNTVILSIANSVGTAISPAVTTGQKSNCGSAKYIVPTGARRGETGATGLDVEWSGVYNNVTATTGYPLCTLTWDLGLTNYAGASFEAGTGALVKDYLYTYLINGTGQSDLGSSGKWYAELPSTGTTEVNVLEAAKYAAEQIG